MERKYKFNAGHAAILLFLAGLFMYVNIDKVPLSHPGNIKAADPFYHALITEGIIDTGQWNYYDTVFSMGVDKVSNSQPPLYYIAAALLTMYSGVPAWATLYILICISQAGLVLLAYLISKEVFDNEKVAILAAGMSVLPLPVHVWLYGLYIGLWLQVSSNFFMLGIVWLTIRYLKRREEFPLFFIGLFTTAVMLLHPQDLGMVAIPVSFIIFRIIRENFRDLKKIVRPGLILGLVPTILFLVLLPKFMFVWGAQGNSLYSIGYYGFRSNYYTREYSGGLVFPDLFFMPLPILFVFFAGILQLILNRKKYTAWIYSTLIYFAIMYVAPLFIKDPYYFIRARSLTSFIVLPTAAYFIYSSLISYLEKKIRFLGYAAFALILILHLVFSVPQYNQLVRGMAGEHIPKAEWDAYSWIHENTGKNDRILFFGGTFQSENIYTKRISASFGLNIYQGLVNEYLQTNVTPEKMVIDWGGETVRAVHKFEKSFFSFGNFTDPDRNVSIYDFDYIFFQDINQEIANANHFFINEYITKKGFSAAYSKDGYIIIKNENKK